LGRGNRIETLSGLKPPSQPPPMVLRCAPPVGEHIMRPWHLLTTTLALTACGGGGSSSTTPTEAPAGGRPAGYVLVWADEFDTPGLPDASKWAYDTERNAAGWYNNELQYYAAGRPENARVEGGRLIITARKESLAGASDYGGQHYTSARL